jgi:hypothetical protein
MKIIELIKLGAEDHPGTDVLIVLMIMSTALGMQKSFSVGILCGVIMLVVYGPIWILGAYERGKIIDKC